MSDRDHSRENSIVRSLAWLCMGVVLALLGFGTALAQTPQTPASAPKSCNYPGGPACPSAPPLTGPWQYVVDPHYDGIFPNSLIHSFADIDYYYQLKFQGGGWCTSTNSGIVEGPTEWSATEPNYSYGIKVNDSFTFNYNDTAFSFQNGPYAPCSESWTSSAAVLQYRSVGCPLNATPVYQASPQVGPYCPVPVAAPYVFKQVGPCCTDGAGPSAGRTPKGDPIDASNGNLYQSEVDYGSGGANPLRFVRSYNSLTGLYINEYSNNYQFGTQIMGVGWMASYFQFLTPIAVTDSTTTYSAVYVFRPNGRVLVFNLYNGVYSSDGDVEDSLIQTGSGWQYQTGDDTIETYNAAGQLLSITPRGKSPVTLAYSGTASLPASVSDAFGHTLKFTYIQDPGGVQRLGSVTDPSGEVIQYAYDGSGNLTSVTHQDGTVRSYAYATSYLNHALTTLTDESGVPYATWTYNGNDLVSGSQLAGGVAAYSITYATNGAGGSASVTDPLGKVRTYPQQLIWGSYRMTGTSAPLIGSGEDQSRSYDSSGNVTSRSDFNGNVTHYGYDPTRNLETSRIDAFGTAQARTISTVWDPNWRQPDLITAPNRTTATTYDATGNVLTQTVTDMTVAPNVSRTWTFTYDSYARVLTAKGPRTDVNSTTTYAYYTCTTGFECGELEKVTDAAGNVTTYNSYNAHGQPLTITDPNGVVTTLVYDARMRLTSRTTGGETTALAYYPTGLLQAVTLSDGSTLQYIYDGAHRLTQIEDGAGNSVQYALDAMGNRTGESTYDPNGVLGRAVSRVFNSLNQLSQIVGSAGTAAVTTTYAYDNNGNLTSAAAPLDRNTAELYDSLNRLSKITDPDNGNTLFSYDANNNLATVQDPTGLTTSFTYDGLGDVVTEVSPSTGTTVNTYDSAGNLSTRQDARGAVARYSYDALNRVTEVAYGDQTLSYHYDVGVNGHGRLTVASDSNHVLTWQYDPLGRVARKTQTVGNVVRTVGYTYSNGDLTTVSTPSGQNITYTYSNHQVSSITLNGTPLLLSVAYEPFGPSRGWTWGNGTTETRLYDADGNPVQLTGVESTSYTVDSAFRIVGIANAATPNLSWSYDYDGMDRVTEGDNAAGTLSWTYDAAGNQSTQGGGPGPVYSAPSLTLGYNNRGRLASVTNPSGTTQYLYDALGQRISKSTTASTTLFAYDEDGHLLGEYDGAGNLIEETIWLGDLPVATVMPNGAGGVNVFYIHADHLNTPKAITRPSDNAIVWRWDQDPYGTVTPNQNPSGLGTFSYNLRFPGQYFDAESGLNHNGFRDYDPGVGRYVESDPLGFQGGMNAYAYVMGLPLSSIDPLGLAIYRGPGNYYSDIPPSGACEQAVMAGDYVVGWNPCDFGTSYRHGCPSDYDYGHGGWPSSPASDGENADNDAGPPSDRPPLLSGAFAQTGTVSLFDVFGCTATGSTGTSGSSWYGGCGIGMGSFSARPSWQGSLSTGNPSGWGVRANVSGAAFGGNGSFSAFISPTGGVLTVGVGPGGSGASANFTGGYRTKSPW